MRARWPLGRRSPLADDELVFAGSGSPRLAAAICERLHVPLGASEVIRFPEGTLFVRVLENVRGRNAYVVQSTVFPTNDRSEEHTSELQSPCNLVCRLLLEKKNTQQTSRVV